MKLVSYARASTEDQKITLLDQQQKLRSYAALYDHELVDVVVGSESGKSISGREEFQKVLASLRGGLADGLLVLKIDRLTRDVADGALLLKEFFGENAKPRKHLFSVMDYIDTRTAAGRMMFNVQLAFAQYERECTAERTKAALGYKIRNHQRVGSIKYGWDLMADGKSLIPNESELAILDRARQMRVSGYSLSAIARQFNAEGIKTKKPGGRWHQATLSKLLRSGV